LSWTVLLTALTHLLLLLQVSSARAALESADLPGRAEQLQETLLPAAEQVRRLTDGAHVVAAAAVTKACCAVIPYALLNCMLCRPLSWQQALCNQMHGVAGAKSLQ
jgi:hypothetical protein